MRNKLISKITNIASRAIVLVLAIQILNLSINSIDFKPFKTNCLTEFNDINTIAEFVSEIIMGKINSFPEFANKTQKQSQLQKHVSLKLINDQKFDEPELQLAKNEQFEIVLKDLYLYEYLQEINPPPPKFITYHLNV